MRRQHFMRMLAHPNAAPRVNPNEHTPPDVSQKETSAAASPLGLSSLASAVTLVQQPISGRRAASVQTDRTTAAAAPIRHH